jgi:hypothetical protein
MSSIISLNMRLFEETAANVRAEALCDLHIVKMLHFAGMAQLLPISCPIQRAVAIRRWLYVALRVAP